MTDDAPFQEGDDAVAPPSPMANDFPNGTRAFADWASSKSTGEK